MKTVFKSDEIAHIWANRGAAFGRCASNMSFEGDAFKSYATVIARRISAKGKEAYVLDSASFGNTTNGKHKPKVARAIRDSAKVFHIHCGGWGQDLRFTPATLRDYYLAEFRRMGDEKPARMEAKRAEAMLHRFSRLESAIEVCTFFGLPEKKLAAMLRKSAKEIAAASELVTAYRGKLEARREAKYEADRLARKQRDAARIAQAIATAEAICEDRQAFTGKEDFGPTWGEKYSLLESRPELQAMIGRKAEEFEAAKLARWQAGEDVSLGHNCPTLLRAEETEMVTSHGARVPLDDARRTYRFALICKAKGWHRNGETHAIGAYQLDAVNENGVVAGCHRVSWAEINRFATAQGWAKEGVTA